MNRSIKVVCGNIGTAIFLIPQMSREIKSDISKKEMLLIPGTVNFFSLLTRASNHVCLILMVLQFYPLHHGPPDSLYT